MATDPLTIIAKELQAGCRVAPASVRFEFNRMLHKNLKLARQIRNTCLPGKSERRLLPRNIMRYLDANSVRTLAAARVTGEIVRKQTKRGRPAPSEEQILEFITHVARSIRLREDCGETIEVRAHPKPNGSWRPVSRFGPIRQAEQLICRDLLRLLDLAEFRDFALTGGVHPACARVKEMILDGNNRYFVIFDIRNCFGSFNRDGVRNRLPLPRRVIDHVLTPARMTEAISIIKTITTDSTSTHYTIPLPSELTDAARLGLPQGSRVSNHAAARLLGPELASIPRYDEAVINRDDGLFPAASKAEALTIIDALKEVLGASPIGPLTLGSLKLCTAEQGFSFLGYEFRRTGTYWSPGFCIRPSAKSWCKFVRKAVAKALTAEPSKLMETIEGYADQWEKAFPFWGSSTPALWETDQADFEQRIRITCESIHEALTAKGGALAESDFEITQYGPQLLPSMKAETYCAAYGNTPFPKT